MTPIRCGVAGVGFLGQHHARIYSKLPNCKLTGIYDPDVERATSIQRIYDCESFASLEALGDACDAVSVVTPTDSHCEVAQILLKQGCHLLIEKPLCVNLKEAEKILSLAQTENLIVQVGHIEHFNPVMSFLEKNVNQPKYIVADRLAPFNPRGTEVGVVLDLMIHDIGIILKLVRSPVKKIESVGVNVLSKFEDIANARLHFANDCVANINASRVSEKKVREIRIFQPQGYLSLDFMDQKGHIIRPEESRLCKTLIPIEKGEPLMLELTSFIDCTLHYQKPKVDGLLGKSALEIALEVTKRIHHRPSL